MHYNEEEKAMWLEDWEQSGKKAWVYAKENGLIPQTFVGWAKKRARIKSGFVEILPQSMAAVTQAEILIEKGDIKIHLPAGFKSRDLGLIIEGLRVEL